jgi:hypothetical protein
VEIQITGGSDAIKVEANEVSLEDLLIALNKAFVFVEIPPLTC